MGGFKPSRSDVPGSTIAGSSKDTDIHQFTGSVDITGSLTLNGSSVTGGGGGGGTPGGANTQVQYNNAGSFAGSANFTFDGSTITVSDDSNITANIGKATVGNGGLSNAAVFAHRDFNNVNSYAFRQRAGTGQTDINAANGQPISFQQNGSTQAVLDASAQFGIGNGIVPDAVLHVSSSVGGPLFRVDHPDVAHPDPIVYVTGSGKVGIGTITPTAQLHISSSVDADENLLFRVDHGNHTDDNPIMCITGSGLIGVGTATPAAAIHIKDDGAAFLVQSEGGSDWFKVQTGAVTFNSAGGQTYAGGVNLGQRFNISPINASMGALGIGQFPGSDKNIVEVNSDNTDNGGDWFVVDQSGSVGINTITPLQTLSVSGSAAFSGAFGSTAVESLEAASGELSSTDGVSIIDVTGLANNQTYPFTMANGTFVGQLRTIYGKVNIGADGANSNAIQIGGSNLDSTMGNPQGVLSLSGADYGGGWAGFKSAGATLLWDGTDWLVTSYTTFNWS